MIMMMIINMMKRSEMKTDDFPDTKRFNKYVHQWQQHMPIFIVYISMCVCVCMYR